MNKPSIVKLLRNAIAADIASADFDQKLDGVVREAFRRGRVAGYAQAMALLDESRESEYKQIVSDQVDRMLAMEKETR